MKSAFSKALIPLIIYCLPILCFSQGSKDESYDSEFIWGINKNTSGGLIGGFVFRKSKRISEKLYQSIGLELINVKHPQELRRNSQITGNFFIFGKSNYLYAVRGQYGRELVLFRKAPQQGVEIKAIGAVGPSIGVLAPYYVDVNPDLGASSQREQYDPSNPNHVYTKILGTGHVFQGITKSKFILGGNLKAALSFELGTSKSYVTGFEAGFLVDAYTKEAELLPNADNKAIYPTAFLTLFYGKRR